MTQATTMNMGTCSIHGTLHDATTGLCPLCAPPEPRQRRTGPVSRQESDELARQRANDEGTPLIGRRRFMRGAGGFAAGLGAAFLGRHVFRTAEAAGTDFTTNTQTATLDTSKDKLANYITIGKAAMDRDADLVNAGTSQLEGAVTVHADILTNATRTNDIGDSTYSFNEAFLTSSRLEIYMSAYATPQAALDAVPAGGARVIVSELYTVNAGDIIITQPGTHLIGRTAYTGGSAGFKLAAGQTGDIIQCQASYCNFEDLHIDGNKANATPHAGIHFNGVSNGDASSCRVYDCNIRDVRDGIHITTSEHGVHWYVNNRIAGTSRDGIRNEKGIDFTIKNNQIGDCGGAGIHYKNIQFGVFTDNTIFLCERGYHFEETVVGSLKGYSIIGGRVNTCVKEGIYFQTAGGAGNVHATVKGVTILNNGTGGSATAAENSGIRLNAGDVYVTIAGCTIFDYLVDGHSSTTQEWCRSRRQ